MLDHSIYTHSQLRAAYLERIQELHPDKRRNVLQQQQQQLPGQRDEASDEFILLREAWNRYEELAKELTKVNNGSREADFTMFGVGCSFADNDAEREKRSEITDQACRGWFSAGELGVGDTNDSKRKMTETKQHGSLLDENMFVVEDKSDASQSTKGKRKSLVDHMIGRRN